MASFRITNSVGYIYADVTVSDKKDSSGNYTISATFHNTGTVASFENVRLSTTIDGSTYPSSFRISVGTIEAGGTKSGSVTINTGNTNAQTCGSYLLVGVQTSDNGKSYTVGAYSPSPSTNYDHYIIYNANGGEGTPPQFKKTTHTKNSFSATISDILPTKEGYNFLGWSINPTSLTAEYQPNIEYTFNTQNVTLYAVWQPIPYNMTINIVGYGRVKINGSSPKSTYGKGEVLSVKVEKTSRLAYLKSVEKNGQLITNEHRIEAYEFSFIMEGDTTIDVEFDTRTSHTLSVDSEYAVSGEGEYLYLDTPTLLVDIASSTIFDGWYVNGERVSRTNPFTLTMPNEDLTLTVETGGDIFENHNVRQFAIQNGNGEVYRLTSKNSKIFLNNPNGLGFNKKITTSRLGNAESLTKETFNMPQISGELIFYKETINGIYEDYYNFVRFINIKPITLWYKIPTNLDSEIYHIPVEVMSINKTEIKDNNCLTVPITMYGLNFWQVSETIMTSEANNIYNNSDFNIGVKVTISLDQNATFDNPKIKFKQNGVEYGAIALDKTDITKVELETRDKKQSLVIYSNSSIIPNPFAYIDFSYADGEKQYPFPKLKQGFTDIEFTYDNEDSREKVFIIEYDKEYLSV